MLLTHQNFGIRTHDHRQEVSVYRPSTWRSSNHDRHAVLKDDMYQDICQKLIRSRIETFYSSFVKHCNGDLPTNGSNLKIMSES